MVKKSRMVSCLYGFFLLLSTAVLNAASLETEVVFYEPVDNIRSGIELAQAVKATLQVPRGLMKPYPAVVIVHGSGGVDGRGAFYAKALNRAAIPTLEIHMFAAGNRPRSTADTWPHVYGALMYLAQREDFDPKRIGVMGFSWGAANSLQTLNRELTSRFTAGRAAFAGHAPLYPPCWGTRLKQWETFLDAAWTGAPVLVQAGDNDDYDADGGVACRAFEKSLPPEKRELFELIIYPGATHKWDDQRRAQAYAFYDEYAFAGKGGRVRITPSRTVAGKSRAAVVRFFEELFATR